jgi:multisubunit Na+/H+ antiporter MnhG subunit
VSDRAIAVDVLVGVSLAVIIGAVFGALVLRTTLGKVHYLAPVTSVAAPLFGAALVVANGWGITAGLDILIVALLALAGPVLESVIGRVEAQQQNLLIREGPQ